MMFGERKSQEDETRGWEERSHGGRGFRDCRAPGGAAGPKARDVSELGDLAGDAP
jgi:hypothetical protein